MRCSNGRRTRFAPCALALALMASPLAGLGCGKKKGEHPPAAGKPISPPVVEPLPAPRGQPRIPAPTAPAGERSPASPASARSSGTADDLDAGGDDTLTE